MGLSHSIPNRALVQTLQKPDMEEIHAEDKANEAFNTALYTLRNYGKSGIDGIQPFPLRFAYGIPVEYTLTNSGTWNTLPNGDRLWQLKVRIPDALSLHAYYDAFFLPAGAKFFVYSEETCQSIGAITSNFLGGSYDNPIKFATAIIYGETMVFEYFHPASVRDLAVISISRIDYGYRFMGDSFIESEGRSTDTSCFVNVNCPQGLPWQKEKRAVAMIIIKGTTGSDWGSGALINNTNNDLIPYFLTANHCLLGLDAISNPNASEWMFYWDYERTGCDNSTPISQRSTVGATVVANDSHSDYALLDLSTHQNPVMAPDIGQFPVYFLGWNRSSSAPAFGQGIHHPLANVKKISFTDNIRSRPIFFQNYWRVEWHTGSTAGGSSGSPLLNSNGQVVGQLGWGLAGCGNNIPGFDGDNYGRFDLSWDYRPGSTSIHRCLKYWLDPNNTNAFSLNGLNGCFTNFSNKTISQNARIIGCSNLTVQNVTVLSGNTVEITAGEILILGPGFEAQLGSNVTITSGP